METAVGAHLYFGALHPRKVMQCISQKSKARQSRTEGVLLGHCWVPSLSSSVGVSFFSSSLHKKAFHSRTEIVWTGTLCADCLVSGLEAEMGITITSPNRYLGMSLSFPAHSNHLLWKVEPCLLMVVPLLGHVWATVCSHVHGKWEEEENIIISLRTSNLLTAQKRTIET